MQICKFQFNFPIPESLRNGEFEKVLELLQNQLAVDFGYDDDAVIESLMKCMQKLRDDKRCKFLNIGFLTISSKIGAGCSKRQHWRTAENPVWQSNTAKID